MADIYGVHNTHRTPFPFVLNIKVQQMVLTIGLLCVYRCYDFGHANFKAVGKRTGLERIDRKMQYLCDQ